MERLHKAFGQLRKLQFLHVDRSMKARIIRTTIYPGLMYGIETHDFTEQQLATLASAVIDVFARRSNMHDVDWFFATCSEGPDLDPVTQVMVVPGVEADHTQTTQNA